MISTDSPWHTAGELADWGPGGPRSSKRWALEKKAEHQDPLERHTEPGLYLSFHERPLGWCLCAEGLGTTHGTGRLLLSPLCLELKLPAARSPGQDLRNELARSICCRCPGPDQQMPPFAEIST